jgi:hypothetical protein
VRSNFPSMSELSSPEVLRSRARARNFSVYSSSAGSFFFWFHLMFLFYGKDGVLCIHKEVWETFQGIYWKLGKIGFLVLCFLWL